MTKPGQAAIFRKFEDKYGLSRLTERYVIALSFRGARSVAKQSRKCAGLLRYRWQ
jgi:hypothetical protein